MDKVPYAILDVETTIFQKGTPYASRNRLCLVGIRIGGTNHVFNVEYDRRPYREQLDQILVLLSSVRRVVGFNLKFDYNWCLRYGIDLSNHELWDLQLGEFLIDNQRTPYPSLSKTLCKYGLPEKDHTVENEYWSVGIDTDAIPREVIDTYLCRDLETEDALYQHQLRTFPYNKKALFKLQCADIHVLVAMEHNGIRFDLEAIDTARQAANLELENLSATLAKFTDGWPYFNFDSGDHLSCLLYGGTITVDVAIPYEHTYKTGSKIGTVVTRNRWETVSKTYPRLVQPIEGSELKKEGFWSTEESVLRKLSGQKKLIDLLLKRSKLQKLISTYYVGVPAHIEKYDWQDGIVHGTFNQCVAVTGRLSSEKPNQQNFPEEINAYITTRFIS